MNFSLIRYLGSFLNKKTHQKNTHPNPSFKHTHRFYIEIFWNKWLAYYRYATLITLLVYSHYIIPEKFLAYLGLSRKKLLGLRKKVFKQKIFVNRIRKFHTDKNNIYSKVTITIILWIPASNFINTIFWIVYLFIIQNLIIDTEWFLSDCKGDFSFCL